MSRSVSQKEWLRLFFVPLYVLSTLLVSLVLHQLKSPQLVIDILLLSGVAVGSFWTIRDTITSLLRKDFSLDYIALLAITTALIIGDYPVATIIVLMLAGGGTLENYGTLKARQSLTQLAQRIPQFALLIQPDGTTEKQQLSFIKKHDTILVRKGEVIPLDGFLLDKNATIDESSLTGEAVPQELSAHDTVRSGTVNIGQSFRLQVTHTDKHSTYRKIIELVEKAQNEKSPLLRLADKYSGVFTFIALFLAAFAWILSGTPERALAVLVVATPCPLILAAPIALLGGMNAAARERIILKHLAALEVLSRVDTLIFDKTGTITLGQPKLAEVQSLNTKFDRKKILAIASSLERHSLHPLAKAIVTAAQKEKIQPLLLTDIEETVSKGIRGTLNGKTYRIGKSNKATGLHLTLFENERAVAELLLEDEPKKDTASLFEDLQNQRYKIEVFTGDTKERTQLLLKKLGLVVPYQSEQTPSSKLEGIRALQDSSHVVAMIGDGLNDAPALAQADVGLVFGHDEHTAASETADGVFLGSNIALVERTLSISRRTLRIAHESIFAGIGLSIIAMLFAAAGFLPPLAGAFIQEIIDVAVILNALRASRTPLHHQ